MLFVWARPDRPPKAVTAMADGIFQVRDMEEDPMEQMPFVISMNPMSK